MATKAQLLTALQAKPRVHSVYSEVLNSTRDNVKSYTIGAMIYVTAAEEYVKRISLKMVVTDEGGQNEDAVWEADNQAQTDYPAAPTAFQQAVDTKVAQLKANGTFLAVKSLELFPDVNSLAIHAIVDSSGTAVEVRKFATWTQGGSPEWALKDYTPL